MDQQTQNQPQVPQEQSVAPDTVQQQILETIRGGKNVLVTVGVNPTVDELSAALGLTFLLGKLDKHATAVFSGKIPSAIEFLKPETTFEDTVDSLRDFIIALDKEKADKLRYKVEDDVVKVFITPYKTVITEKDLEFSQGDFNVDIVIALGVEKREELDQAITAHGRILHDAAVITVNAGQAKSNLGAVDWNDTSASSVSEMLVSLSADLGTDLLDEQISTAFLTGVVAETNRFSNEKTSPKVMTIAAQLMATGANQQLIATNLRHEGMISESVRTKEEKPQTHDDDGEMVLKHDSEGSDTAGQNQNQKNQSKGSNNAKNQSKKPKNNQNSGQNNQPKQADSVAQPVVAPADPTPPKPEEQLKTALDEAAQPLEAPEAAAVAPLPPLPSLPTEPTAPAPVEEITTPEVHHEKVVEPLPSLSDVQPGMPEITPLTPVAQMEPPTFGGTLSATTASAEEDAAAQAEREASVNNVALQHGGSEPVTASIDEARRAVEMAAESQFDPGGHPLESIGSTPLPQVNGSDLPDSTVSQMQSAPVAPPAEDPSPVDMFMQSQDTPNAPNAAFSVPDQSSPSTPSGPTLPPVVDPSGLPPLPPMPTAPGGTFPPLPPMPTDAAGLAQPQINPEFMGNVSASQNQWTQAGQELTSKQAEAEATRQAKMDEIGQQYDAAVDKNRELNGLPPVNSTNPAGLPPLPPL